MTARWSGARYAALLSAAVTLTGCAIHGEVDPAIGAWPPAAADERESVSVIVTVHAMSSERPEPVSGATLETARKEVIAAFEESGLFSDVHDEPAATDRVVELDLTLRQTPWGGITVIVHWTWERAVTLTASVVDDEGARSAEHTAECVSYTPMYLVFVFFEAFWRTDWVISSRARDLTRSFISSARARGDL